VFRVTQMLTTRRCSGLWKTSSVNSIWNS